MKIIEKKLIPAKIYPICDECETPMDREKLKDYTYLYKCPNCNKEEKSDIYYPYIKYIGEEQ